MSDYSTLSNAELNERIAGHFEAKPTSENIPDDLFTPKGFWEYIQCLGWLPLPFATDGNAMVKLIEAMVAEGWEYYIERNGDKHMADFYHRVPDAFIADTPPRAVAEAALQALESEGGGASQPD